MWSPHSIGRLETLRADWTRLRTRLFLPTLNESRGQHPETSADQYGRRAALLHVLDSTPRLRVALACLLFYDYACYGFPLPAGASARVCGVDLNATERP